MEFSQFSLRIVLLFMPGLVAFLIVDKLTAHRTFKPHSLLIYSLLLGFYSYVLYAVIVHWVWLSGQATRVWFFEAISGTLPSLDLFEIVMVTVLAVPVGFAVATIANYRLLHRLAQSVRVSRKSGDLDVWSYVLNSYRPRWVAIRDWEHDIIYEGWIEASSDSSSRDEVFPRGLRGAETRLLAIEFPAMPYTDGRER
jgi:hypothetical protein